MKYKQCILKNGNSTLVCWLDAKVKEGWLVQLEDSDQPKLWWKIVKVSNTPFEKSDIKGAHGSENWYKKDYLHKLSGLKIS